MTSPAASDDAALVRAVQSGDDRAAFAQLVARHQSTVRTVLRRLTRGDTGLADDLAQETFVLAWRNIRHFRFEARFSTWIYKIAVNAAIDQLRKGRVEHEQRTELPEEGAHALAEQPAEAPDPERRALASEIGRRTLAALDGLTPTERAAFLLRHYEGRSIAEISSTLGKRENATKQSIFRAVRKLRAALAPFGGERLRESDAHAV